MTCTWKFPTVSSCPSVLAGALLHTSVLPNIDYTLTTQSAITRDALGALCNLKAAGLPVIAVTGSPGGRSEPFAQAWPVNAIVAENGAAALFIKLKSPFPLIWPS